MGNPAQERDAFIINLLGSGSTKFIFANTYFKSNTTEWNAMPEVFSIYIHKHEF